MERVAHVGITRFVESPTLIPKSMQGFRNKLSSLDGLVDLTSDFEHDHGLKKNTLAVLLHIKKGYNNIAPGDVVLRLGEAGMTGQAQVFVQDFFRDRCIVADE